MLLYFIQAALLTLAYIQIAAYKVLTMFDKDTLAYIWSIKTVEELCLGNRADMIGPTGHKVYTYTIGRF